MNLFITGTNGYIGNYLLKSLKETDNKLKLLIYGKFNDNTLFGSDTEIIRGDLRDKAILIESLKNIEAVIHLGAIVGSYIEQENIDINHTGTINLINACKLNNVKRFIFISSVSAKRNAQGPYGYSKMLAEESVIRSGLDYTIFRPTTVMGRESLGLNRIIKNVNRFPFFIPMVGDGKQTRHPVYVKDFVELIISSINNRKSIGKLYEIGGEKVIYFMDLVKLINEKLGNSNKPIIPVPFFLIKIAAYLFERLYKVPPFTSEHLNSLTEDTIMDNQPAIDDLAFNPIPTEKMLEIIINEIKADPPELL